MRRSKMLPPAVRWLCLLFIAFKGTTGEVMLGGTNEFLAEDLRPQEEESTTLPPPVVVVGDDPHIASATELPPDANEVPEEGDYFTSEAISTLEEEDLISVVSSATNFGKKITSEPVTEMPVVPSTAQFSRRILVSGTVPVSPVVPDSTVTFPRPTSLKRFLSDPANTGWLPNWPSELLDSKSISHRPTIRFPSDTPSPTPTYDGVPDATPVPSIVPSFTVSKVPVTQYFFDITSAAPSPPPGPLFDPDDLNASGTIAPGDEEALRRPVIELSSSIPELQSSAFLTTDEQVSSTPTLSISQTLAVIDTSTERPDVNEGSTSLTVTPTRISPSVETEVIDNDLANENYSNVTTLVSEIPNDLDTNTSGPQPSLKKEKEDPEIATQPLVETSSPMSTTDTIAVLTKEPQGTGAAQPDSSATSRVLSESELVSSPSTISLNSIKPTSVRPLQGPNTSNVSRTPLWMLLNSQSVPSKSTATETSHTILTSAVTSVPMTDILATPVPTLASASHISDVAGAVTVDTDLVSSLLISSQLISSNSESPTATVDILDDGISSLVPSVSLISTSLSTDSVTEPLASTALIPSVTEVLTQHHTSSLKSAIITSPLHDPSSDDSVQALNPSTPKILTKTEHPDITNTFVSTTPQTEKTDVSENNQEIDVDSPSNITVDYPEISDEPLIVPISKDESWPQNSPPSEEGTPPSKVSSADWTPIVEKTETSLDNTQITPSSTITTDALSSATLLPPVLTGGFIPVTSEIVNSTSVLTSQLMPGNAISSTSAVTAIVASTSAPNETFSTLLESSSLTDSSSVLVSSVISDNILTQGETSFTVEQPLSSVATPDELMPSNFSATTAFTSAINEPTSVSLIPSSSQSSVTVDQMFPGTKTTDLEPSMIVIEEFPSLSSSSVSSLPIPATEILPSLDTSSSSLVPSERGNVTPVPSVTSIIPEPTPTLLPSKDFLPPPLSSTAALPTSSDLPSLVTPTVTEEKTEVTTAIANPEESPVIVEEPWPKDPEEGDDRPTIIPPEPVPAAVSPEPEPLPTKNTSTTTSTTTTPSPTTTTTTTTTEKDIESETTTSPPNLNITSPVFTTPQSPVTVTYVHPSESMPSLTTSMILPNGTELERPLPFIRALVAYSEKGFCQQKENFQLLFAEWISSNLEEERRVSPEEIEFFGKPYCGAPKTESEEYINHLPENLGSSGVEFEEKLNTSNESKEEATNVFFYITQSGAVNPNLTEEFPLFPMQLQISEELIYLREKVSQLELVRPDGSSDSAAVGDQSAISTSVIIISVIVAVVGFTIITALIFFMIVKRRGASNNYYGRRCTPVSMDAYSMDSVSVYHSFRRKSKRRASGRSVKSYLNQAFDDPNGPSRPLNFAKLTHFISDIDGVHEEFGTIPVNMPKYDELPAGVEDKNRYANVIPVPETRVLLKGQKDSHNSEYINANYVRGPRNETKYYIATQAPLDDTVADFWRMIWEQETRVVVMLTDFVEKGIDKCADYLPPSETLDCHRLYGDFQITLKSRDMREKFVVSNVQLKNLENNLVREVAHMWFTGWPAAGVPNEESAFISYILDVRRTRKKLRAKGPILVHCSPGTGRAGTFLACDLVMRQFEDQRAVDIPRTVYSIRRDRAGAVQTKEQYAFIYRVINLYASKLTTGNLDSL